MRVVFFGTPPFAAQILARLLEEKVDIVGVVTKPDKPVGRSNKPVPCAVKVLAQEKLPHVPLYQPEKVSTPESIDQIKLLKPDLFVVVAYGEILKKALLDVPKLGSYNIHASLLPKYRGAAPIQRCIMDGVKESGVSIITLALKMDAGDIVGTAKMEVPLQMNAGELEEGLCKLGGEAILEVLHKIEKGTLVKEKQDESQVTFAHKLELEDAEIHWDASALDVHNRIRAFNPRPGAWCTITFKGEKKRLKLHRTEPVEAVHQQPGTCHIGKGELLVHCQIGALRLLELQLEGRKSLPVREFLQGVAPGDLVF